MQDLLRVEFRPDRLPVESPPRRIAPPVGQSGRRIARAAMIGNYPPRMCGIATFTRDLQNGMAAASVRTNWLIAAISAGRTPDLPDRVTHVFDQDDPTSYVEVARALNAAGTEVAYLQHEFGIYGGPAGEHVLILLRTLRMPVITTLHTVLEQPNPDQKRVMDEIIRLSARVVVMARKGAELLARVHPSSVGKTAIAPHGAPFREDAPTEPFKEKIGLAGRPTITTFGLLGPGKGLETVVRALPRILARSPNAVYLVVGATHPNLVAEQGEAYRESIVALADSLGVGQALRFINRFVSNSELADILQATDVYVTPYLNEQQITSGTLSYALALGRPVVSTPYWHAAEALADDVGILCKFGDADDFAASISGLLTDHAARNAMSRRAYQYGAASRWPNVGRTYINLGVAAIAEATERTGARDARLSPSLAAVKRLFDDCGMLQHGKFRIPDRDHGYCTDDNARALVLLAQRAHMDGVTESVRCLAYTAAAFVNHAWNPSTGRFRNFMSYSRQWLDEGGGDDCNARALEALFVMAAAPTADDLGAWAVELGRRAFQHAHEWRSLRSVALVSKSARKGSGIVISPAEAQRAMTLAGNALMSGRAAHGPWFESRLGYDNARLPEALILAGRELHRKDWVAAGLESLEWLVRRQTRAGVFCPVGTSAFDPGQTEPDFDQQPIEALAAIDAFSAAWEASGAEVWRSRALAAHAWFLGENLLGASLATEPDGGCFDGLTAAGPNCNQGAESVLCRQLAALSVRRLCGPEGQCR